MKEKLTRGFTLIELLVVIAIIGILASVVLASLNTARDKGADAAAKSSINNMRAQAEIFYDTNGSYTSVCGDPTVAAGVAAAGNATGKTPICSNDVNGSGWAANVQLKGGGYYCVDSTGNSTTTSADTISANSDWTC